MAALLSRIVKIKCKDETGKTFGQNTTMIATIETPHTLITGPPGLIKVDREGSSVTILKNCGPFGIWIERDTKVGFADKMNGQDTMEKMDYKFINAMTSQIKISSIKEDKA